MKLSKIIKNNNVDFANIFNIENNFTTDVFDINIFQKMINVY